MKYYLILLCLFWLPACKSKTPVDQRLVSFEMKFVSDVDVVLKLPKEKQKAIFSNVISPNFDTVVYKKGELYVSFLGMVTGCAEYNGDLDIRKDTIRLRLINTNGEACTEQNCYRLVQNCKPGK